MRPLSLHQCFYISIWIPIASDLVSSLEVFVFLLMRWNTLTMLYCFGNSFISCLCYLFSFFVRNIFFQCQCITCTWSRRRDSVCWRAAACVLTFWHDRQHLHSSGETTLVLSSCQNNARWWWSWNLTDAKYTFSPTCELTFTGPWISLTPSIHTRRGEAMFPCR